MPGADYDSMTALTVSLSLETLSSPGHVRYAALGWSTPGTHLNFLRFAYFASCALGAAELEAVEEPLGNDPHRHATRIPIRPLQEKIPSVNRFALEPAVLLGEDCRHMGIIHRT